MMRLGVMRRTSADNPNELVRFLAFYRRAGNYRGPGNRRQFVLDRRESRALKNRRDRSFGGPRFAVEVREPDFASEE